MDDPNMTMEEYIKFDEEKDRRRGRVFNWKTATYGKIRVDDDLYDLRSVEAEFPAIVIDDTVIPRDKLTCKSQVSTPVNDEIDFRISFDESDDEDYTIICDKNSFSYKMISVNDLKTNSENDNKKAGVPSFSPPKPAINMDLPPREQRHRFLRYEGLEYTDTDIEDFEARLARIDRREDDQGVSLFTSRAWRRLFDIRGPLVHELILDFFSTFRFGQAILDLDTPRALQFQLGGARRHMSWREFILALGLYTAKEMQTVGFGISSAGDFLGTAPSYTMIWDPILRLCHRLIACSIAGRSQAPEKVTVKNLFYFRGMDVDSVNVPYLLARLPTAKILGGLTAITPELLIIDMAKLPNAMAGAPVVVEDALAVDEGGQALSAPVQAPWELAWTCGEIDDRSGEIIHMDDDMYDAVDGC
ncbi:hypothetical protein Tco_0312219 [Tanacetum coccineum]